MKGRTSVRDGLVHGVGNQGTALGGGWRVRSPLHERGCHDAATRDSRACQLDGGRPLAEHDGAHARTATIGTYKLPMTVEIPDPASVMV